MPKRYVVRVTAKDRVPIPRDLGDKPSIVPGSEVEFIEEGGRLYLCKVEGRGRGRDLVARMRGRGTVRMTTDEILALTRGKH